MKRILFFTVLALFSHFAMGQEAPSVTIQVVSTTPTKVTASFTKNATCTKYHILIVKTTEIAIFINQVIIANKVLSVYKKSVTYNNTVKATDASPNKIPFLSVILKKFTFFVSISEIIFKVNFYLYISKAALSKASL